MLEFNTPTLTATPILTPTPPLSACPHTHTYRPEPRSKHVYKFSKCTKCGEMEF